MNGPVADATYDVFVSFNSLDRDVVEPIAKQLQARNCSSFIDQWYLKPGHDWVSGLEQAPSRERKRQALKGTQGEQVNELVRLLQAESGLFQW